MGNFKQMQICNFNQMIRFYVLLLLLISTLASNPIISDYALYLQRWKEVAASKQIVNVTNLVQTQERCNDGPCQIYYYLQENQQLVKNSSRNKTVLIVAGLKGNDYISANIVLNLYKHIQAARVIYLPIANPSGFVKNTSKTFPNSIDVQSDFPNAKNKLGCYQSSAVNILDSIYKRFQVDLAILIQEGSPSISYPSFNSFLNKTELLQEQQIYRYIFSVIRKKSTSFQENQSPQAKSVPFQHFQIDEAPNTFIDWAYGASRFPQMLKPQCRKFVTQDKNNLNGLTLALSIGKLQQNITSDQDKFNIFMLRILGILRQIVFVVNPRMNINFSQDKKLNVQILGCSSANLTQLRSIDNENSKEFLIDNVLIDGIGQKYQSIAIKDEDFFKNPPKDTIIQIRYACDLNWQKLGPTIFSKLHQYTQQLKYSEQTRKWQKFQQEQQKGQKTLQKIEYQNKKQSSVIKNSIDTLQSDKSEIITIQNQKERQNMKESNTQALKNQDDFLPFQLMKDFLKTILIGGLVIVTVCYLINCFKVGAAVFFSRARRYQQKFEEVQYVQNTQYEGQQDPNHENQHLFK